MSRLLHDILKWKALNQDLRAMLASAVRVDLQNVAEHLHSSPKEHWAASEDIPSCAPPWPVVWGEYKMPRESNNEGTITRYQGVMPRFGLLMASTRAAGERGWRMAFRLFLSGGVHPLREVGFTFRDLGADGISLPGKRTASVAADLVGSYSREAVDSLVNIPVDIMLLAFAFCHCKNVVVRQEAAQDRESRHARASGRASPRWHVLEVGSEVAVADVGTDAAHAGESRGVALHICRGHFARYTEEMPLFGRLVGTFWVPQHVKGSKEHGVVQKDYRVAAPSDPVVGS